MGAVGLFWNSSPFFNPTIRKSIDHIYEIYFDNSEPQIKTEKKKDRLFKKRIKIIKNMHIFSNVEFHTFLHKIKYKTEDYIGLLKTHSDHSTLPTKKLNKIITAVREILNSFGGEAVAEYKVRLILCKK